MGESKPTPGDWQADFDVEPGRDIPIRVNLPCINGLNAWFEIGKANAPDESEIGYTDGTLNEAATVANARLIAAAPELLEALKTCEPFVKHFRSGWSSHTPGTIHAGELHDTICAAIAKAEGRS